MMTLRLLVAAMACFTAATAQDTTESQIFVCSPDGSPDTEPYTIAGALALAMPGDTLQLEDGVYPEPIVTVRDGMEGSPITITGGPGAIINGYTGNRLLMWDQKVADIRNSWTTLNGFTVDGQIGDADEEESYVDKCVFVEGNANETTTVEYNGESVETILIGFVMTGVTIRNCGMECLRMRNFVTHAIVSGNDMTDCGIWDYRYRFDGEVGEAIYCGTSSNQWDFGKFTTNGPDGCNYNVIKENNLTPNGNECVDIKEGARMNVVEFNDCSGQLDPDSGCFGVRGSNNIVRNNTAQDCAGAGIRLGGHTIDDVSYGVNNTVYGNHFSNTGTLRNETNEEGGGSVKIMEVYQAYVCENSCEGDYCDVTEKSNCLDNDLCDDFDIDFTVGWTWDQDCDNTVGYLGCFLESNRAIQADYDSDISSGATVEGCTPKCSESEIIGTMEAGCYCGVVTANPFYYPCHKSNDGVECSSSTCVRMFDV
ncbi:unnamed protein product [Pylaiella littoralis]